MEHPNPNPPESAPMGHELRDAAPLPILIFAVSLVVTLVLVHLVARGALNLLQSNQDAADRIAFPTHPLSGVMPTVPPEPRLEPEPSHDVLPRVDLVEVQARERALIGQHAWGWVDSSHQFVRIPIEQAMKLAVEHGLPNVLPATRPSTQPFMPPASALHGPGGVP
ncbi:MAG: hypothetical protein ABSH08_09565 [Tepidisphaeraceae bacterium]|jgi:hypothetical protein